MVRKTFLLLTAALLASPAAAADMPRKARAVAPSLLSGCYFGVAVKGGVDQATSSSSALFGTSLVSGNLNAMGAGLGGDVGCMEQTSPGSAIQWWAVEATAYYQNVTADGAGGAQYASRWSADQTVKLGGFNPLGWLPNLGINLPALPPPPTIGGINLLQPGAGYFSLGVEEWGIGGQFFSAGGTTVGVAPLIGAGIVNKILDSSGNPTGNWLDTGAQVVFADKAFQVTNFLGNGGQPMLGTLTSGRKYEVYAKINF